MSFQRDAFVPRDIMEEGLHSVLRRLMEFLHHELNKVVPDFASSILRPPHAKVGDDGPSKLYQIFFLHILTFY